MGVYRYVKRVENNILLINPPSEGDSVHTVKLYG